MAVFSLVNQGSFSKSLVPICSLSPADEVSYNHDYNEDEEDDAHSNGHIVVRLVSLAQVNCGRQRDIS